MDIHQQDGRDSWRLDSVVDIHLHILGPGYVEEARGCKDWRNDEMKKSELLARIIELENRVTILQAQLAMQRVPVPVVSPWTAPAPPWWPPVTICEAAGTQ